MDLCCKARPMRRLQVVLSRELGLLLLLLPLLSIIIECEVLDWGEVSEVEDILISAVCGVTF